MLIQINVLIFKMIDLKQSVLGTFEQYFVLYRAGKEIENFGQQRNLLSNIHQHLISISLCKMKLNIKFYSIPFISFCARTAAEFGLHR